MTHSPMSQNRVRDALEDMLAGWQYIRRRHGDLDGVGWDRAEQKAVAALTAPPASDAAGVEGLAVTEEMVKAGYDAYAVHEWNAGRAKRGPERDGLKIAFQAMLAAAPTAPAQAPSRPVDAGDAPVVTGFAINPEGGPDIAVEGHYRFVPEDEFLEYKAWAEAALATQAPDKAGAREGLGRTREAFDKWFAFTGLEAQNQGIAAYAYYEGWAAALATQPTGTEASRPVGGEALEPGEAEWRRQAANWGAWEHKSKATKRYYADIEAATPTPPQADSTGQGDAQADAIKKQCAEYGGLPARCLITERNWSGGKIPARCRLCPDAPALPATPSQADAQTQEGGE